jgi:hypothetical protein
MLPRFANTNGSLDLAGLVQFQNHPVVVAQFTYWVNMRLFAGSNVTLGLIDLVVALGVLGLIGLLLRDNPARLGSRLVVFVMSSCLLFTPNGAWNFVKAMSGTAWFTADLLVVGAVYLRAKDRSVLAFAGCVLAAVSYGTGIMVWPAVVVVGLARRPLRQAWRELPFVAGFAATYVWYRVAAEADPAPFPGVGSALEMTARLLVLPIAGDGRFAVWIGAVAIVAIIGLVAWGVFVVRTPNAAAWAGVAVFGLLGTVELASGRTGIIDLFGLPNRYASVPALAWIGLAGLVLTATAAARARFREPGRSATVARAGSVVAVAGLAVIALLAGVTGGAHVRAMQATATDQRMREVALVLGLADNSPYLAGFGRAGVVTPVLRGASQYPFVDGWNLDCGLLDEPVDSRAPIADRPVGRISKASAAGALPGGVEVTGATGSDRPVDCIVVADDTGRVVGAGVIDETASDPTQGRFRTFAREGSTSYRVYVIFEGDPSPVPIGDSPVSVDG